VCFVVLIALLSPRLALVLVALFSSILERAYDSFIIPLLGFFLLPWTTLVYALLYDTSRHVYGIEWLLVVAAFLIDITSYGVGRRWRTSSGGGSSAPPART
jgi:hypothetical protein